MPSKPLCNIETNNFPSNSWGRKTKLLFTEESLPYLKWSNSREENTAKACTPVQSARVGAKLSFSILPHGKLIDVQDTDRSSEPDDTGFHIESQVGKGCKITINLVWE